MSLTLIDYDGLMCPTFVCDHCGEPIQAREGGDWTERGWVLYDMSVDPQGPLYFVHQRCDRPFSDRPGQPPHFASRELTKFMAQLAYNTEHGFPHSSINRKALT